jgi:hypothetical protein
MSNHPPTKKGWADTRAFRSIFLGVLAIAAVASAVAGFLPQFQKKHPHFDVEGMGAFFGVYGFLAFSFIVLAGQHLRKLVGRKEDYYEDRE